MANFRANKHIGTCNTFRAVRLCRKKNTCGKQRKSIFWFLERKSKAIANTTQIKAFQR